MVVIIACRHNDGHTASRIQGSPGRVVDLPAAAAAGHSPAMMPKRLVAAVLIGALVLAAGGVLGSLFF
jgi:hypothetical protein